jgi:hypothetical protein
MIAAADAHQKLAIVNLCEGQRRDQQGPPVVAVTQPDSSQVAGNRATALKIHMIPSRAIMAGSVDLLLATRELPPAPVEVKVSR